MDLVGPGFFRADRYCFGLLGGRRRRVHSVVGRRVGGRERQRRALTRNHHHLLLLLLLYRFCMSVGAVGEYEPCAAIVVVSCWLLFDDADLPSSGALVDLLPQEQISYRIVRVLEFAATYCLLLLLLTSITVRFELDLRVVVVVIGLGRSERQSVGEE